MHYVPQGIPIYYIDPNPALKSQNNLKVIAESATIGINTLMGLLEN